MLELRCANFKSFKQASTTKAVEGNVNVNEAQVNCGDNAEECRTSDFVLVALSLERFPLCKLQQSPRLAVRDFHLGLRAQLSHALHAGCIAGGQILQKAKVS